MSEITKNREQRALDNARETIVAAIAAKIGLNEAIAIPLADAVLDGLRDLAPGQMFWIPARSRDDRNEQIRREFNGRNHAEVMKKFGISRRMLYYIIGRRPASPR